MSGAKNEDDKSYWVIGGTTMIGVGVGFIFFPKSVFLFVACIMIGIGLGLAIAPFISSKNTDRRK